MTNSRNKGVRGEREIIAILTEELGGGADRLTFKRDIEQYRQGDLGDVICSDPTFPFVVEVKLYGRGTYCQPQWWDQVCVAAEACHKLAAKHYLKEIIRLEQDEPDPRFVGEWAYNPEDLSFWGIKWFPTKQMAKNLVL